MKIGFIGLGTMGKPMADNLHKAGYELLVYNRNSDKAAVYHGYERVQVAASIEELVAGADIIWTILSDDQAVREVLLGEQGVLPAAMKHPSSRIVVDSSTISPQTSMEVADRLRQASIELVDAPVTGSEPQAQAGSLTFIVGGSEQTYDRLEPLFLAMGKQAIRMGEQGAGAQTKLANNMMAAITLLGVSEALSMVAKAGVSPERFLQVVSGGGARNAMAEMKGPRILARDFSPQFMTKLMHKDLKLAGQFADELQVPTPMLHAAKSLFAAACGAGYGEEDMSAVIRLYEEWTGVKTEAKGE